ncbi:MAG TPA: glycosyltransferase [Acidothermaceae bacterium]
MRILFVAPLYDYGVRTRGYGFEYYNFFESLVAMGHDVSYFDVHAHAAGDAATSALVKTAIDTRPDLLFACLFRDELDPAGVRQISESGATVTFNWFCDDHWRFDSFSAAWAPSFNFVSTTAESALPKYRAAGIPHVLKTQWGAATHRYRPTHRPLTYDVTFVGQKYGTRGKVIESVRAAGISIETWGTGWNIRHWQLRMASLPGASQLGGARYLRNREGRSRISQDRMIATFEQSRVSLNLTESSQGNEQQIKGRTFEVPACGGLLLTGAAAGLDEYYEAGKEVVVYDDASEVPQLCRRLLDNPDLRDQIAAAGFRRTIAEHTYAQRFSALFKQMGLSA